MLTSSKLRSKVIKWSEQQGQRKEEAIDVRGLSMTLLSCKKSSQEAPGYMDVFMGDSYQGILPCIGVKNWWDVHIYLMWILRLQDLFQQLPCEV